MYALLINAIFPPDVFPTAQLEKFRMAIPLPEHTVLAALPPKVTPQGTLYSIQIASIDTLETAKNLTTAIEKIMKEHKLLGGEIQGFKHEDSDVITNENPMTVGYSGKYKVGDAVALPHGARGEIIQSVGEGKWIVKTLASFYIDESVIVIPSMKLAKIKEFLPSGMVKVAILPRLKKDVIHDEIIPLSETRHQYNLPQLVYQEKDLLPAQTSENPMSVGYSGQFKKGDLVVDGLGNIARIIKSVGNGRWIVKFKETYGKYTDKKGMMAVFHEKYFLPYKKPSENKKKSCVQLGIEHNYIRFSDNLLKCLRCGSEKRKKGRETMNNNPIDACVCECGECGKRFKKRITASTVEIKCPGCGGYDVDIAENAENPHESNCTVCGAVVFVEGSGNCPSCGSWLEVEPNPRVCDMCGSAIVEGTDVCFHCSQQMTMDRPIENAVDTKAFVEAGKNVYAFLKTPEGQKVAQQAMKMGKDVVQYATKALAKKAEENPEESFGGQCFNCGVAMASSLIRGADGNYYCEMCARGTKKSRKSYAGKYRASYRITPAQWNAMSRPERARFLITDFHYTTSDARLFSPFKWNELDPFTKKKIGKKKKNPRICDMCGAAVAEGSDVCVHCAQRMTMDKPIENPRHTKKDYMLEVSWAVFKTKKDAEKFRSSIDIPVGAAGSGTPIEYAEGDFYNGYYVTYQCLSMTLAQAKKMKNSLLATAKKLDTLDMRIILYTYNDQWNYCPYYDNPER